MDQANLTTNTKPPLVTKEEHLRGYKVLTLRLKWGEPFSIALKPLSWRQLQDLSLQAAEEKWPRGREVEELVQRSIIDEDPPLPKNLLTARRALGLLDAESAALLQQTALAFSLGERAVPSPNAPAPANPAPTPIPIPTPHGSIAGAPNSPSPLPASRPQKPAPGVVPSSPSIAMSSSVPEQPPSCENYD